MRGIAKVWFPATAQPIMIGPPWVPPPPPVGLLVTVFTGSAKSAAHRLNSGSATKTSKIPVALVSVPDPPLLFVMVIDNSTNSPRKNASVGFEFGSIVTLARAPFSLLETESIVPCHWAVPAFTTTLSPSATSVAVSQNELSPFIFKAHISPNTFGFAITKYLFKNTSGVPSQLHLFLTLT
jgi:hypothetical protein